MVTFRLLQPCFLSPSTHRLHTLLLLACLSTFHSPPPLTCVCLQASDATAAWRLRSSRSTTRCSTRHALCCQPAASDAPGSNPACGDWEARPLPHSAPPLTAWCHQRCKLRRTTASLPSSQPSISTCCSAATRPADAPSEELSQEGPMICPPSPEAGSSLPSSRPSWVLVSACIQGHHRADRSLGRSLAFDGDPCSTGRRVQCVAERAEWVCMRRCIAFAHATTHTPSQQPGVSEQAGLRHTHAPAHITE